MNVNNWNQRYIKRTGLRYCKIKIVNNHNVENHMLVLSVISDKTYNIGDSNILDIKPVTTMSDKVSNNIENDDYTGEGYFKLEKKCNRGRTIVVSIIIYYIFIF